MTKCNTETIEFTSCKRRKVQANFRGGEITSDAGVMPMGEVDKKLRLTEPIAPRLNALRTQLIFTIGFIASAARPRTVSRNNSLIYSPIFYRIYSDIAELYHNKK